MDLSARRHGQEVISENAADHSPDDTATLALLMPWPSPNLPLTSISPASPSKDPISNGEQSTMLLTVKKDAHEVRHEDAGAPYSCSRPVIHQPMPGDIGRSIDEIQQGEDEWFVKAAESHEHSNKCFPNDGELASRASDSPELPSATEVRRHSQDIDSGDTTSVTLRLLYVRTVALSLPTSKLVLRPWDARQLLEIKPGLLLVKVLEEQKKRPSQEAISEIGASTYLYSPRSSTALALKPVKELPSQNSEFGGRLRWRPPDSEGGMRRHARCVVSKNPETSVCNTLWDVMLRYNLDSCIRSSRGRT